MDSDLPHPQLPAWRIARRGPTPRPVIGGAPSAGTLLLPPAYALLLGAAELLASATQADFPALGPVCFGAVLLLLGSHAALSWTRPRRYVPLAAAAAPALRLLLFPAPGGGAPLQRGLALGLPLLLAGLAALLPPVLLPGRSAAKKRTWPTENFRAPWAAPAGPGALGSSPPPAPARPFPALHKAGIGQEIRRRLRAQSRALVAWGCRQARRYQELEPANLVRDRIAALRRRAAILGRGTLLLPAATLGLALFAGVWVVYAGGPRQAAEAGPWAANGDRPATRVAWPPTWAARPPAPVAPLNTAEKGLANRTALPRTLARRPPPNAYASYARPSLPQLPAEELAAMVPSTAPPPAERGETQTFPNCPSLGLWNPYPRAVCTWYAKERRPDLPAFVGDWGLAVNWPRAAELCGFRVDGLPQAGAVIVFPPGANGAYEGGHVGYVEEVQPGALLISECNADQDSAFAVSPQWWDSGYSCTFRRIPWEYLSSQVIYIHGFQEPAGRPTRWSPAPRDGVDTSPGAP